MRADEYAARKPPRPNLSWYIYIYTSLFFYPPALWLTFCFSMWANECHIIILIQIHSKFSFNAPSCATHQQVDGPHPQLEDRHPPHYAPSFSTPHRAPRRSRAPLPPVLQAVSNSSSSYLSPAWLSLTWEFSSAWTPVRHTRWQPTTLWWASQEVFRTKMYNAPVSPYRLHHSEVLVTARGLSWIYLLDPRTKL